MKDDREELVQYTETDRPDNIQGVDGRIDIAAIFLRNRLLTIQ